MNRLSLAISLAFSLVLGSFSGLASANAPDLPESYTLPYTYSGTTYTKAIMTKDITYSRAVLYMSNASANPTFNGGYGVFHMNNDAPSEKVLIIDSVDDIFGNGNDTLYVDGTNDDFIFALANPVCFTDDYLRASVTVYQDPSFTYQNANYHCNFQFGSTSTVILASSNFFDVFKVKHPLPGGEDWLLTVEIGGESWCGGTPDNFHTGSGYYSLDFDDLNQSSGSQSNVPIYAVASGFVDAKGYDSPGFGHYITINHRNGYKTLYAHMQSASSLSVNDTVSQGQQLGIVGNSGTTGTHLHLQFYYGGSSASTVTELSTLLMEGSSLASYVVSSTGSPPSCYTFYPSTNTP